MSTRKRKMEDSVQQLYDSIMELLSRIKPSLDDPKNPHWPSMVENLHRVASLAETFTEQRPKSSWSTWSGLADSLDQEGVNLWNVSGSIRKPADNDGRAHLAAARLAAFRMIEAGLETRPGTETLIHVLQLASKAGMAISDVGNNVLAASVLTSAAKFEEQLKNVSDPEGTYREAIACATIAYHSARMETAWKEGNHSVADYMSRKIIDDTERLTLLPIRTRELLAFKHHQIGGSLLKDPASPNKSQPNDAIQWLQRAFSLIDRLEDATEDPVLSGIPGLKISVLRTMARAYFLSESYDRAETVLDELIPIIDDSRNADSDYRELRWLRLAVLKRRKATSSALLDAFKSIINHMELSEANITEVLQDLRTLTHYHTLVTAVNRHCLEAALPLHSTEPDRVHRLILSLIVSSSKDDNHARATETLESTFTSICDADIELPAVATTACLTLVWQYGGRHYKSKRWSEAADWYLAGSHKLFRTNNPSSAAKCFRKAALCYIEKRDFAEASTVIRRCPSNEAPTHYITFLTAINQGLEDEAIRAIHDMLKAPDFDRKMLLLATQISHQSDMKSVLLVVLEGLLKSLKIGSCGEAVVEAVALIRCIIRLALKILAEPIANKPTLIDIVVNQFRTARILTEAASSQKVASLIHKDISWLWRTAYNCAVQGCSEWENSDEQISELFTIARALLDACCNASPVDINNETCLYLANASFAAVSGRVFSIREMTKTPGTTDDACLRTVAAEIKAAKDRVTDIMRKHSFQESQHFDRIQYFVHVLRIFEAEFSVQLKEWDRLKAIVEELNHTGSLAVGTFEAIADILWLEKSCPVNVLYPCLEAILKLSLEQSTLSVEKFSRWLRALCTISLARDTPEARLKAIGYVEHALNVIEDHNDSDEAYPMDERQWLLGIAFNTGTECLYASHIDEAKRWFEAATVICRFVPGGKEREDKISETYTRLLTRFGSKR